MKTNKNHNRIHSLTRSGSDTRTCRETDADADEWRYEFLRRKARLFPKAKTK